MLDVVKRFWRKLTGGRHQHRRRSLEEKLDLVPRANDGAAGEELRTRLTKHRVRVRHSETTALHFGREEPWSWSLKVLEESDVIGVVYASTPISCLALVAPYFAAGGEPREPFKVLVSCTANHRALKVDRLFWPHLAEVDSPATAAFLANHFGRDLSRLADRSSVTVMVDGRHEVVDSRALFRRVFGLE